MKRARMVILRGKLTDKPVFTEVPVYMETIHVGPEAFDSFEVGYYHDQVRGCWFSYERTSGLPIGSGFKFRQGVIDYTHKVAFRVLGAIKDSVMNPKHIISRARKALTDWSTNQIKSNFGE
ncbi:MAG: hypothetical protein IKF75_05105 [Lachnospiraceae bacterium]|nr:hypothetical protein [Lachnospiraceae bacterium]